MGSRSFVGRLFRLLVPLVLAATLLTASAQTASAAVVVRGTRASGNYVWRPKITRISRGTVVKWRAVIGSHTVKAYGGNWSFFRRLPNGTTVRRAFRHRGTFKFYCTIHGFLSGGVCSGMCGKIVVG